VPATAWDLAYPFAQEWRRRSGLALRPAPQSITGRPERCRPLEGRTGSRGAERRCVFGRLTRFAGVADDGSLELYLGLVRERVLPVVRAIPGFSGYLALSDGERGEVLVLTLWASEQQMRASEETTVQLRSQAADKVGATVLSVERFRVAISELDIASG
jgi:heme-degrading monooxygenase HmoA